MNAVQAAILGVVEGVTEYLPISSTFHLIWASKILGIPQSDFQKLFEVVIQTGAILAVLFIYFRTYLADWNLNKKVLVSFIPTSVIGLVLYKLIKNVFFENWGLQLTVFILVGLIFLIFERYKKKDALVKATDNISYRDAVIIGLGQALAVIPGVSRAGAVIVTMMYLNVKRNEAAKYSFLLAVPTLVAASALDLVSERKIILGQMHNIGLLLIGTFFSFISALVVVKWFITYLQKHNLNFFGYYRLGIALILILLLSSRIL